MASRMDVVCGETKMKTNLKNRPNFRGKSLREMTATEKDNAIIECVQWFDAIEKELQSNLTQNMEGLSKENKAFIKGFQHAIKEVLGVGENKP